ncbi:MAG: hypothetical protein PX483_14955 [Nostocales cyanobacterium LE14-WE4]|nr:hypothetical protein [Anabaena sp. AL09]MCE2699464.1 hypothetical protein [Anabaena sp. 49633_E8]MCE2703713.1 hypothetical protein [Anabaena sp. 49633_E8]MDJ0502124.1 hypothetical protein [Nostocales cyanobacterium LE14-WE4]
MSRFLNRCKYFSDTCHKRSDRLKLNPGDLNAARNIDRWFVDIFIPVA